MAGVMKIDSSLHSYEETIRSTAADFFQMVPSTFEPSALMLVASMTGRGRARTDGVMELYDPDGPQVMHELAHFEDYASPWLYEAADDWRKARGRHAHGAVIVRALNELVPEGYYDPSELAIDDSFYDPYVGVTYDDLELETTEVMSTGLQHFTSPGDMLRLYLMDPEHFLFVVGAIGG